MKAYTQFPSHEGRTLMELEIPEGSVFTIANRFDGEVYYDVNGRPVIIVDSYDTAWDIAQTKREEFNQN